MLTDVKVGDKMYSLISGYVEVTSINDNEVYPIIAKSVTRNKDESYTMDGVYMQGGDQVLFWDKPSIIAPPRPPRKVKKWVAGFIVAGGEVIIRGCNEVATLFPSREEASTGCIYPIAFVTSVKVEE